MKILATDLDGTLFYPKEKKDMISKENLFFIQNFIDNGGKVILASGRSIDYGKRVEEKISRPVSIIGYNGTCLYDEGKTILKRSIPNEDAKNLIKETFDTFKNFGVFLMSDRGVTVHLKYKSKFIRKLATMYYKSQKIYAECFSSDEKDYLEELEHGSIYKIMIFFGITKNAINKAKEANKILGASYENFECAWSGMVIEITLKGCTKANVLTSFIEEKKYDKEDVYVVGDSGNDISMFKHFHENSFCMSHSPSSVKKYARFTIDKFADLSRYIYQKD